MNSTMACIPIQFLKRKAISDDGHPSIESAPSTSLALKAQKKILGKIGNRMIAKHFVNDTTLLIFDNLYKILKSFYNKNIAKKTINNMLKIAIKLSALLKDDQMTQKQKYIYHEFQKKMRSAALTVISFTAVDYSYDKTFLIKQLEQLRDLLAVVVSISLSEKSVKNVDKIFQNLMEPRLLDEMFIKKGEYHSQLVQIVTSLESIIDGNLQ